jgi:choline dehydrogenase-like flavoprotein
MIEDARHLPTDVKIDADIAIIGGGAAGISMALNFLHGPLKVVVLESGGIDYESKTQSLYRGRNVGLRYEPLDLCRVRMFGGSTDERGWAGWCKTFSDLDFEQRAWVGLSGWPISKRDLRPFYKEALKTVSLPAEMERMTEREAHAPDCLPLEVGDCVNDPVPLSTAPRLSDAWLETIRTSPNVRVILHANVTRIYTDEMGDVVTGLHVGTLDRRMLKMKPRFTVLAAGGIESARLLLSSNQTVKTGLGNASDWVGRCFMDHPRYAWGQITSIIDPSLLLRYNPTLGVGQRRRGVPRPDTHPLFGVGVSPNEAAQRREQMLGSRTWIVPVSAQGERAGGRELREVVLWAMRRRIPSDIVLRGAKIFGDLPNAAAAAVSHLRSVAGQARRWQFQTIVEPEPNPSSRVTLDNDRDPLGLARVKLDWRLTPLVRRTLQVTQDMVVKNLRSIGLDCHVEGPGGPAANQKFEEPRWTWHHMGTARMSDDPNMGVVDADCKVHGVRNLYVTGSSVFPTSSTDMPTLTLIALAHRLSAHLRTQLLKKRPVDVAAILPFARAAHNVYAQSVSGH